MQQQQDVTTSLPAGWMLKHLAALSYQIAKISVILMMSQTNCVGKPTFSFDVDLLHMFCQRKICVDGWLLTAKACL